ncbi:C10 family peptidase [Bacteroides fragilis]
MAGCVPIAIAQIAKYYEWPVTYSWTHIPLRCNTNMEDDEFFKKFIKDIRSFSKVTYKDKATGATMGNAVKAFKKLNYSATPMDYKRSETIQEIQNNRPVFMGGDRKAIFF